MNEWIDGLSFFESGLLFVGLAVFVGALEFAFSSLTGHCIHFGNPSDEEPMTRGQR